MTAIADQSDAALWDWRVWAVLVAAALITLAAHALAHAPEQEPELSWLDQADGAAACHLRCGLRGTVVRVSRADLGMDTVRVCPGHSDEGDGKGWWDQ